MSGSAWTDKEIQILRDLAEAGYNSLDIAKVLKSRTAESIHAKASSLKISLAGLKPEIDFEAFRRMIKTQKLVKEG